METNNNLQNSNELGTLISGLKSEDNRNEKIARSFQWLYWAILPIYIFILIFNPDGENSTLHKLSLMCYIVGMALFAVLFRVIAKDYKKVNYSISTIEMLKKAACRYKLFQKRLLLVIPPVLFIGAGLGLSSIDVGDNIIKSLLISQAGYWGAICLGFGVGVVIWFKRSKPLRDHALKLIKEIEA